jgi:hypothetical protein
MSRWQASGLNLLVSAVVAAAVLAGMLFAWYPSPLFEAEGGMRLVLILVAVNVVIGPLITLIIYKPGKWGLKFDLWAIPILQLAALLYGGYVVFQARPVFLVLVKDQFELVSAVDLQAAWLEEARRPEFRTLPVTGPALVAFDMPADDKERQDIVFSAIFAGRDAQHYPKYFVPYLERAHTLLAGAQPIELVRTQAPGTARVIDAYLRSSGRMEADVRYYPMRTRHDWVAVLVDAKSGEVVKMLLVPD